jgi:hypothetical protein
LPNISFRVQQIRAIPVLSTPLSVKLARRTSSGCHTGGPPQVGYVTLNQTRKIVPLLEMDPAVSIAPIVGVWTAFDEISDITIKSSNANINATSGEHDDSHEDNAEYSNLSNTLSWAAMIRFLFNENIKDRVFISGDTFLLVGPIPCHE